MATADATRAGQVFGAGGVNDQAGTHTAVSSTAPAAGSTARVQSEEVIALAAAGPLTSDGQLTKAGGDDADFVQRNIANANPEFNHRNLTHRDVNNHAGGSEADMVVLDVLDGVAQRDALWMYRGSSDQTETDTTLALQSMFAKAYSRHQSTQKSETESADISTQALIDRNPFKPGAHTRRSGDSGGSGGGGGDAMVDESDAQSGADPVFAAAQEDGLDFYFANPGPTEEEASNLSTRENVTANGLRRVGQRKARSTILSSLADEPDIDEMRRGFDLQQRSEGMHWTNVDAADRQRQADIERIRFPGAQYLAHQNSHLLSISERTATGRSKAKKKRGAGGGTLGGLGFA